MDILEAKQILSAYQGDGDHFSDPHMLEALGLLETDSELARWFENQLAFDSQIKSAVATAPAPERLRASILERQRMQRKGKVIRTVRWFSAIAALLILSLAGFWAYTFHYNSKMHEFATLREGMAYFIAGDHFTLDFVTKDLGKIENWLVGKDSPVYESLPPLLLEREPIGCKKMNWRGQDVSLVCFHREDGKIVHLFVAERDGLSENAFAGIEDVAVSHGLETGGWVSDGYVYLLTGSEPGVTVSEYLG